MEEINLGPCCGCEQAAKVENILMLNKKSPEPGSGWGCFQCHAAMDGAFAVLCEECLARMETEGEQVLKFACAGYVSEMRRVPINELTEPFGHDMRFHPEGINGDS